MDSKKVYSSIGKIAALYDVALDITGYKNSVEYFMSQLPFGTDESITVLDAGCGTGLYTIAVLEKYPNAKVTAFDLNEKLVEQLRNKIEQRSFTGRTSLFTGDLQGPLSQITDKKFNLIITAGVLEYVSPEKIIQQISNHLIPGGYFFNSPVRDTAYGKLVGVIYRCRPYTKAENIHFFENNGFKLEKVISLLPYRLASFKEGHLFRKI